MMLQPSSRILGKTAARSAVRGAPGSFVPSAGLASAAKAKKKKNKKAAEELTYAQQKVLAKERRRQTYEAKTSRETARQTRRDGSAAERGQHSTAFRSWFDRYRTRNETMDRKARQAGLPWRVRVAAVV